LTLQKEKILTNFGDTEYQRVDSFAKRNLVGNIKILEK